ncbi:MAG: hypothetical protein ABI721_02875 [Candidatus Dojkabacteria bacterium]
MKDLLSKANMKLGATFGVPAAVLTLLSFIPCLGWIFSVVSWVVLLVGGYVTVMVRGGSKEQMSTAIKNSLFASIPAAILVGVASAISSVLSTLFFFPRIAYFDIGPSITDFIVPAVIGLVFSGLWVVVMFLVGSAISVYYPETNLPSNIRDMLNKFKGFATA